MRARAIWDGEAIGLAVPGGACVRLRSSWPERLLTLLRWTLGTAAAVVVMWVGVAFHATTASAVAALPAAAAAQQGLLWGGVMRPAASNGDGEGESEKKDKGESDKGDQESGEKES